MHGVGIMNSHAGLAYDALQSMAREGLGLSRIFGSSEMDGSVGKWTVKRRLEITFR
jgi:hypothetical protein